MPDTEHDARVAAHEARIQAELSVNGEPEWTCDECLVTFRWPTHKKFCPGCTVKRNKLANRNSHRRMKRCEPVA